MKKTVACLAALMTLMSLTACSDTTKDDNLFAENKLSAAAAQDTDNNVTDSVKQIDESIIEKNNDVIFENDNVVVTKFEPLVSPNVVYNLWDMPTEAELYDDCDIITDVTIKSLDEVAISYTFMGTECTSYKTLAHVSVNNEYYSSDENIEQEFTVAIPNSSYSFDEDFPEIAVGKRCILFISDTSALNDSLELDNYADYYLSSPANIININGADCQANKIFASYSNSAISVQKETGVELLEGEVLSGSDGVAYIADDDDTAEGVPTEQCAMPFADFENTLITKINEKLRSE